MKCAGRLADLLYFWSEERNNWKWGSNMNILPIRPSLIIPRLFCSRVFIFNFSKKLIPIHWSSVVALFGLLEFRARTHEQLNLLETIFWWILWHIDFTCRITWNYCTQTSLRVPCITTVLYLLQHLRYLSWIDPKISVIWILSLNWRKTSFSFILSGWSRQSTK